MHNNYSAASRKEKYIKRKKYTASNGNTSYYLTVQIELRTADGKRKSVSKTFNESDYKTPARAMKAAVQYRDRALNDIGRGNTVIDSDCTVDDIFSLYRDYKSVAIGTYKLYLYKYNRYIKPVCGQKRFQAITVRDIQKSLDTASESCSQHTLGYVLTLWKDLFKIARLQGIVLQDLSADVTIPKSQKILQKRDHSVSVSDMQKLIEYMRSYDGKPSRQFNLIMVSHALMVSYYLGLRPAETFALLRRDLQSDGIHVGAMVSIDEHGHTVLRPAKSLQSYRILPVSTACLHLRIKSRKTNRILPSVNDCL